MAEKKVAVFGIYNTRSAAENGADASDFEFLQKPYTSQELLVRLEQILASHRS